MSRKYEFLGKSLTYSEFVYAVSGHKPDFETSAIFMGALGLAGEAGEVADLVKKKEFHEKPITLDDFEKELGDVLFYLEYMCQGLGTSISRIELKNVSKLKERYPNGFSPEAANAPRKEE